TPDLPTADLHVSHVLRKLAKLMWQDMAKNGKSSWRRIQRVIGVSGITAAVVCFAVGRRERPVMAQPLREIRSRGVVLGERDRVGAAGSDGGERGGAVVAAAADQRPAVVAADQVGRRPAGDLVLDHVDVGAR